MKTTLELPDELMRDVKILAINRQKKLKDTVSELIQQGLEIERRRTVKFPKPYRLRGGHLLTFEEIRAAIEDGRD